MIMPNEQLAQIFSPFATIALSVAVFLFYEEPLRRFVKNLLCGFPAKGARANE
jgi:hypothetical protein